MQYRTETLQGHKNLIWCICKYSDITFDQSGKAKGRYEPILEAINPDIAAHSYSGVNLMNLKALFAKIKAKGHIGDADFRDNYRSLITEPLKEYLRSICGINKPLWGAWYLAEDEADPYGSIYARTFTDVEYRRLRTLLLDPEQAGEAAGYALCVFAGLTVHDALNARYRDLYEMKDHPGAWLLHVRGTFPKQAGSVTKNDIRPRFAILPGQLHESILQRKAYIDEKYEFPIINEDGVFHDTGDLPIACAGIARSLLCRIDRLSGFAENILREGLGFDELRAAYISKDLLSDPARYAAERSMAYSTGRCDYAARLHAAGVDDGVSAYLLGYRVEGERGIAGISEDPHLYDAYEKIETVQ